MTTPRITPVACMPVALDAERMRAFGFNRRPGERNNRGRVPTAPGAPFVPPAFGPLDPLTLVSSVAKVCYLIGDLGVTDAGGGLASAWADQSGGGKDFTQATGAAQPAFAAQAAINNRIALTGDGIDDVMANAAFNFAANYWVYMVFSPVTWTNADGLTGASSSPNRMAIRQSGVTPQIMQQGNLGTNTVAAANGSWHRLEAPFGTTTADYLHIGPTTDALTANTGVTPGTGRVLFALAAASNFANARLALYYVTVPKPTAPEIAALDAWAVGYYGAGVNV